MFTVKQLAATMQYGQTFVLINYDENRCMGIWSVREIEEKTKGSHEFHGWYVYFMYMLSNGSLNVYISENEMEVNK